MAFSIICNCTPNTYSCALSIQALFKPFEKVPRAIWAVVSFVIYSGSLLGLEHEQEAI
jgi:purine-cytosine permease-like protein